MDLMRLIKKASELSSKYKVRITLESSLGKKGANEIWLAVYRNGYSYRRLLNEVLLESSDAETQEAFLEKSVRKFLYKVRRQIKKMVIGDRKEITPITARMAESRDKIVDMALNGAPKEDLAAAIEESKQIIDEWKS